ANPSPCAPPVITAVRAFSNDAMRISYFAPSAAKLFYTELAGKVADLAMQIHGGSGYLRGAVVSRVTRRGSATRRPRAVGARTD
ncbi:hypothetical protein DSI85_09230, partial [Mycobacterium tuberculosis]